MSTDEQDRQIGQAHRRRKEALQELKCLFFKAQQMGEALGPIRGAFRSGMTTTPTPAQLDAYPSPEVVRALVQEVSNLKEELSRLNAFLGDDD